MPRSSSRGGRITVTINTRPLNALVRAMPGRNRKVVRDAAFDIRNRAFMLGHVLTGSMVDSIYVRMSDGESTYSEAATDARADNPRVVIESEAVPPSGTRGQRIGALVGVAAQHGVFEEIMRGHRFLIPAALGAEPAFMDGMRHIVDL